MLTMTMITSFGEVVVIVVVSEIVLAHELDVAVLEPSSATPLVAKDGKEK